MSKTTIRVVKPKYYKMLKRLHPDMSSAQIAQVNLRLTIVDEMNLNLEDMRLKSAKSTVDMLQELNDYYFYLRNPRIVLANSEVREGKELVFFEV